jgi:serine/threonine protein phosphatase PrpC
MYAPGEIPRNGQQTYICCIADGHGILGDKSASYAGKALTRHVYSSNLRNKHLAKLDPAELMEEMRVGAKAIGAHTL